ncbi:Actin-like protein arp9 (SWI/SNF complex component arp9) [Geranomyces michiganensis]|nr:Actin-like protein arp9 (SWI/SNF complex component arp9) [Geranomyces michiganensis]
MSAAVLLAEAWSEPRELVWSNFRVAIVDDNFINQKILCRQLNKYLGINVRPCDIFDNGKLLLDRLAHTRYDLILLDIEMPVLDGMETAVRIRSGLPSPDSEFGDHTRDPMAQALPSSLSPTPISVTSPITVYPPSPSPSDDIDVSHAAVLPENREVPIIAVTCNAQAQQRQQYLALGINAVAAKPLQPEILIPTVKHYLQTCQYAYLPPFPDRGGHAAGPRRVARVTTLGSISSMDDDEEDSIIASDKADHIKADYDAHGDYDNDNHDNDDDDDDDTHIPSVVAIKQPKAESLTLGGNDDDAAGIVAAATVPLTTSAGKAAEPPSIATLNVDTSSGEQPAVDGVGQLQVSDEGTGGGGDAAAEAQPVTYIAGAKLAADREAQQALITPLQDGVPVDWTALAGLWQHILLRELATPINRSRNDWSILLAVPVNWGKEDLARATQIMFEELNFLAFSIIEQPLAALYGCNMTTGLVIDIGHETTDITPIIDNCIVRYAHKTISLGGRDVELYLKRLLLADPVFVSELGDAELSDDFVRAIKENVCEYTIGSARYRCPEVFFDPISTTLEPEPTDNTTTTAIPRTAAAIAKMGIAEACYLAVTEACEAERRTLLWDSLLVTGGSSALKGLRQRLDRELMQLVAASETSNEFQAKEIKWMGMPDYFTAYKDAPNDVTYLGASIVARVVFTSSAFTYVTKSDYNEMGPAAIYLKA